MRHLFGIHISLNQNLVGIVDRAQELKLASFQVFGGNPRQWKSLPFDPESIKEFKAELKSTKVRKFFLHSIYLINLASSNKYNYENSILSLIDFMNKARLLDAEGVITHIGSAKGKEGIEARVMVAEALNRVLNVSKSRMLLLENTAWGEGELGSSLEGLAGIYQLIKDKKRIGFCLDMAHLFESGYNIKTEKGLTKFAQNFDKMIGIDRLRVIHLNDSKTKLGSKHDRHEVIGGGEIGDVGLKRIINFKAFDGIPMILETPDLRSEGEIASLEKVREMAQ